MYVLCPAVGDVVAVCVVLSICGLIWFLLAVVGIHAESMVTIEVVVKFVKHFKSSFLRRFWSVGQARESMVGLTQGVWWCVFVIHLAARR